MTPAEYNDEMARYCEALDGWGLARVEREILVRRQDCAVLDAGLAEWRGSVFPWADYGLLPIQAAREQYRLACRRLAKLREK